MLTWIFMAGGGYALATLLMAIAVQRFPRRPVNHAPDWGHCREHRVPTVGGGQLELWRVEPDGGRSCGTVVMLIQGENDRRFPVAFARKLQRAFAPGQAQLHVAVGAGHSDSSLTAGYAQAVRVFVEGRLPASVADGQSGRGAA